MTDRSKRNQHISRQFNEELTDIRSRVLHMGGLVEQQISDALRALRDLDTGLAERVTQGDYRVNALEVAIDEECTAILARRQPAASDLRMIVAVIKTIADLERIGDEAERLGRMALRLAEEGDRHHPINLGIQSLGTQCLRMVHDALDAFARLDAESAIAVVRQDATVDQQYDVLLRQLVTYMTDDPRLIGAAMDGIWSIRSLERIGDHARNIGEYIIYLVHGRDIRHTQRSVPGDGSDRSVHGDSTVG
jgi:phosphate transport system protein